MTVESLLDILSKKIAKNKEKQSITYRELSSLIGVSQARMQQWKRRGRNLTELEVANLVTKAMAESEKAAYKDSIKAIVEFFKLDIADSNSGAFREIFQFKSGDGRLHLYYKGIRDELRRNNGIYIFYDSRGRAIYVGKAVKQKLWGEIKSAFNRERGDVQSIKSVNHPGKNRIFKTSDEKQRQIRNKSVPISALAVYLTAYTVPIPLVAKIEALLVRGFANDLLNVRMERLAPRKKSISKTKTRRATK